jgi:hypothetical protein
VTRERFEYQAASNLEGLKPEYTRNRKNVVEYAELKSEKPFVAASVAAAVLTPRFLSLFERVFGSTVLVAIPSRGVAYVFPKLASTYSDYAPMVLEAYHDAAHPVSTEVFEVGPKGMRAVGIYEEP